MDPMNSKVRCSGVSYLRCDSADPWFGKFCITWNLLSQVHVFQNTDGTEQVMQQLMHRDGSGIPFYIWDTASYQGKELDTGFPDPRLLLQWPVTLISLTLDCANVWMFSLHF